MWGRETWLDWGNCTATYCSPDELRTCLQYSLSYGLLLYSSSDLILQCIGSQSRALLYVDRDWKGYSPLLLLMAKRCCSCCASAWWCCASGVSGGCPCWPPCCCWPTLSCCGADCECGTPPLSDEVSEEAPSLLSTPPLAMEFCWLRLPPLSIEFALNCCTDMELGTPPPPPDCCVINALPAVP